MTLNQQETANLQGQLGEELARCIHDLRAARFPASLCDALHEFELQIRQPFTLAVVGLVKAGKSSLVNALLGIDLPTVGATETTATVNVFRDRDNEQDDVEVFVCRRGSHVSEKVPVGFLTQLQGDSEDVVRRVADIDHLEFRIPNNSLLKGVVLVDTPGLEAVSGTHQDTTASLLGLASQLRQRNVASTAAFAREADGIVYVMHHEPREKDRLFLEEFHQSTRPDDYTRNTIAVIGRSDSDTDVQQWDAHACSIQASFGNVVLRTIPTSVEVHRFVTRLVRNAEITSKFHRFCTEIDDEEFESLLNERRFRQDESSVVSITDRRLIANGIEEWTAFQAAAIFLRRRKAASEGDPISELSIFAGIDALKNAIQKEMVEIGPLLRCRRIAWDAETLIDREGKAHVRQLGLCDEDEGRRAKRLLGFLERILPTSLEQDKSIVAELGQFVRSRSISNHATNAREFLAGVQRRIAIVRRECDYLLKRVVCRRIIEQFKGELHPVHYSELTELFDSGVASQTGHSARPITYERAEHRRRYWQEANHPTRELRGVFLAAAAQEYELSLVSKVSNLCGVTQIEMNGTSST